jgi:hypothetical protein
MIMRYVKALALTGLITAAASFYTPSAHAGVYVGVGLPAPVIAPRVVADVGVAPGYYAGGPVGYVGVGYRGPGYWGGYGRWGYGPHAYGYRGYGYGHPGYGGYRGWGGYHHR